MVHHSGPQLYLDTLWHRDPWRLIRCLPLHSIVQHFVFVHNVISCFSHVQKVQHHVVMQFCVSVHIVQSYGSKCHFITALLLSLIKMSGLPLSTELMTTPRMYLDLHIVLQYQVRPSKQSQTGQTAFAASSFSSCLLHISIIHVISSMKIWYVSSSEYPYYLPISNT